MKNSQRWVYAGLVTFTLGCGSDKTTKTPADEDAATDEELHEEGTDTGALCPSDSTLKYDTFGRDFMDTYCTRCHASTLSGKVERSGAPDDHNFDSLIEIQAMVEHLDHVAAGGPEAVNEMMPPSEPRPSVAERKQLGEWLACGAP